MDVFTSVSIAGPFTVLAPTNDAIASLDAATMTALTREPVLLKQIIQYHIIPEYAVLPELANIGSIASLEGQPITFSGSGGVSQFHIQWQKI